MSRFYHAPDRDYRYDDSELDPPPRRAAPGKIPTTARITPAPRTEIVFRVADPAMAAALAGALGPSDTRAAGPEAGPDADLIRPTSGGAPLPGDVRARFEQSLGADLGAVRVHTDSHAALANRALGARAFARGQDIQFAEGQYAPTDPFGLHLLAHEVAHTVQQGRQAPRARAKLIVSSPGDAAEREADRAADAMVRGEPATVGALDAGVVPLRPQAPSVPGEAFTDVQTRELGKALGGPTNAVDRALAAVDWQGYMKFAQLADGVASQYNTNSPQVDIALQEIESAQTNWSTQLGDAYEQEKDKIAEVLNSDPTIRGHVKEIQSKTQEIEEALTARSGELTTAEGALDTLSGLKDAAKAAEEEENKEKLQARKAAFEDAKAKAIAEIEANAAFLKEAIGFAESAAKDGLVSATKDTVKSAVVDQVIGAYTAVATGKVNAEYNGRIKAISAKIGAVTANIKALESSSLASQIAGATKNYAGAMKNVKAHNERIARLTREIEGHRSELEQTFNEKHKDVALFRLTKQASAAMEPLIETYRGNLAAAKQQLEPAKDHKQWLDRLNSVKAAVSATDRLLGGDHEALATGEVDFGDLENHQRLGKDSHARKQREETARRLVETYQRALAPHVGWLTSFGAWYDAEVAFVEGELNKCFAGEFTAFIREFEGKVHGLIDGKFL